MGKIESTKEQKKILHKITNSSDIKKYKDQLIEIIILNFLINYSKLNEAKNIDFMRSFKIYLFNFNELIHNGIDILDLERKQFFNIEESYFMEED